MEKEKEIEEMARVICLWHKDNCEGCSAWVKTSDCTWATKARKLQQAGYGNVKKAVNEFADYLTEYARACQASGYDGIGAQDIQDKFKEFYGEDKESE